ncbi:hypothetical protein VTK73DRAFT_4386 [Phialemonium thermophilum]|uniref:VOC domain-containing protein n=1 Tax=Phialemonium thermophilum TaxID=223376 RepID=A0ABR3XZI6_9PEZI
MLPFLEVTHLPSSASFYSAVLQPLNVKYLSTERSSALDPNQSLIYGTVSPPKDLFQLRQVENARVLRVSRIVLAVSSAPAVHKFHSIALRAHPELREPTSSRPDLFLTDSRARITDLDGNIMEVVYIPPSDYRPGHGVASVRRTQSTASEASRILDWNYDVASSSRPASLDGLGQRGYRSSLSGQRSSHHREDGEPYSQLRRSVAESPGVYDSTGSPRRNSSGLSTGAVVGTLLGVVAGAAAGATLTYSMMKKDKNRHVWREFEAPPVSRRSTYPEPLAAEYRGRHVEVDRTGEKRHYSVESSSAIARRSPPKYVERCSVAETSASRPHAGDEVDIPFDYSSRRSSRFYSGETPKMRSRSEVATTRRPLLIENTDPQGFRTPRYGNVPPVARSTLNRSNTYGPPDRANHFPTRSLRGESTARADPSPCEPISSSSHVLTRSKTGSRTTTSTVKVGSRSTNPPILSRTGSYISARNVPLPPSVPGTNLTGWEDDADSIAPSDSISCVGSRKSGVTYH